MSTFKELMLNDSLLSALADLNYETPTPIQEMAIPPLLEGKDLLGIAQTGTGKTGAFSLPVLHELSKKDMRLRGKQVRTLILTPTRELASQIVENIEAYGKNLNLKTAVVFGGVSKNPQIKNLKRGVDILVATPGRLLDLMNDGWIDYCKLDFLILDEADRMLDMGFIRDIKKIMAEIPEKRQTLLFSATMPPTISKLATSMLNKPVRIEITPQATTVEKITQKVLHLERTLKPSLLLSVLEDKEIEAALVFSRTKHGADRIVKGLVRSGITAAAIHGNKSQGARERALKSFKNSEIRVLVATDIAARGIDIPQVGHVINYNLPEDAENYVHRIGRTGRAGRSGVSISFCDETEVKLLKNIERTIKMKIDIDKNHPFSDSMPDKPGKPPERRGRRPSPNKKKSFKSNGRRRK